MSPAPAGDRPLPKADLMIVDNAAQIADEAMEALRLAVAMKRGRLLLLSAPGESKGFFFRVWEKDAGEDWVKIRATAQDCARLPADFLEEERKYLGAIPWWRAYMCNYDDEAVGPVYDVEWVGPDGTRCGPN